MVATSSKSPILITALTVGNYLGVEMFTYFWQFSVGPIFCVLGRAGAGKIRLRSQTGASCDLIPFGC